MTTSIELRILTKTESNSFMDDVHHPSSYLIQMTKSQFRVDTKTITQALF